MHPKKILISFCTRWGPRFGGINSFNQDLLTALAGVTFRDAEICCVVLSATTEDIALAASAQVQLISLNEVSDVFSEAFEATVWDLLCQRYCELNDQEKVWLGHDRITGSIALSAAEKRGGRSLLIHHMSYASYESFAENSGLGYSKESEQRSIFRQANIVMAVGPLLRDRLAEMLDVDSVPMLVPGLPEITAKKNPKAFKVFLSGRLSEDAKKIKQAHLGVAAFGAAISLADANLSLPDPLRGENEPRLTLRGVDFERSTGAYDIAAELELKLFAERYAGRAFALHALPFTTSRDELFSDLAGSTVALMPSWHEGFGLVAWEAIGAGVPIIVSKKSGVFRLITEIDDGVYVSLISSFDVFGQSESPYFTNADCENLAQAIIRVAKDSTAFRKKASRLREALAERFSWSECARQVASHLGWVSVGVKADSISLPLIREMQHSSDPIKFLQIPHSNWSEKSGFSSSQLLRAEEAVVPFDEKRLPFLNEVLEWAKKEDFSIALQLLVGPGGVGKTRLGIEVCSRLNKIGWISGFLSGECDIPNVSNLVSSIVNSNSSCLIVLDYAETRQAVLLAILRALQTSNLTGNVRILLLARDGGEWWDLLPSKDPICEPLLEGLASTGPYDVPALHNSDDDRQAAYQLALATFAERLKLVGPHYQPQLTEAHFAFPLYIQMAALSALYGDRPKSAEALTRTLVGHERRYWRKTLAGLPVSGDVIESQAALLMTIATLASGVATYRDLSKIWDAAGGEGTLLKPLFAAISPLYRGIQGLDGWRPDLLGEALIAQVLLSDSGAPLLNALLKHGSKGLRKSTLTVLARMLPYRDDIIPIVEDALVSTMRLCVDEIIAAIIQSPTALPKVVENAFSRLDKSSQWQIAGILEPYTKFDVLPLSGIDVLVSQVSVRRAEKDLFRKTTQSKINYIFALANLSIALDRDGQEIEAIEILKKALELQRGLAEKDQNRFNPKLASILGSYARLLSQLGNSELALSISTQALKMQQSLVNINPKEYESGLIAFLNRHSAMLTMQGQFEEAKSVSEQSLAICLRFEKENPGDFQIALANCFGNYGAALVNLGLVEDAVKASEQSAIIFERLAKEKPERFEDDFAISLSNYSGLISKLGHTVEAVEKSGQSLAINLRLAAWKPQRFEPALAHSLNNHASHLSENGDGKEASILAKKSLDIWRRLALNNATRYEYEYVSSLGNYADHLAELGKFEEADAINDDALYIAKKLFDGNRDRHRALVGRLWGSSSLYHGNLGNWLEAANRQRMASLLYSEERIKLPHRFAYSLELSLLNERLWNWLSNLELVVELQSEKELTNILTKREAGALDFLRKSNAAFITHRSEDIELALQAWRRLEKYFIRAYSNVYLTLAAIGSGKLAASAFPENWHDEITVVRNRMGGRLPRWMVEVASRAGREL